MQTMRHFTYPSSDGLTQIHAVKWLPDSTPRAMVQISHGMVEYIERYDEFARYLNTLGIAVYGNDHLGHGGSITDKANFGYFAQEDGALCVLRDLKTLTGIMKNDFPEVPLFLLGHSMGSFFARWYLGVYGQELSGAIISGTGFQPAVAVAAGKAISRTRALFHGWHYRSKMVNNIAFASYNKGFHPARTDKDWLTRDEIIVNAYIAEERCSFIFTLNGFLGLFTVLGNIIKPELLRKMPRKLPVLFIAGDKDPVGGNGKGVLKVVEGFKQIGMQDVTCILYPEHRHEVLNEIGREAVYEDVSRWLGEKLGAPLA